MPKFPTYERGQGLRAGSTASYASEGAFTAPARALANMGGAVADLGSTIEAGEQRIRNTQSDAWLSKARAETALEMQTLERDLQKSATEGAADYTPTAQARYEELRKAKLAQAPSPRAAQAYQQWSDGFGVDVVGRASRFQAESELAKRTSDFADAMTAHAQVIYSDPSQYEVVRKRAMDDFAGAKQWMTPEQETAAREKVDHDLKLARSKSLVEFAPEQFRAEVGASAGKGDAASLLRKFEGFRSTPYWDVNAHRIGYGSDTITRADGSVVKVTKDMKVTRADAERDLARRSKEFEATAVGQVGAREWGALPAGARAALTSVAYNYGSLPAPVVSAVKSGDIGAVASAVDGLSSDNGGINAKRRREEAAIIRGAPVPNDGPMLFADDPRYAGLSVDEIRSLSNQADSTLTAQQTTAYAQMRDSLNLGIVTGDVISEEQILGSGLDDGDKATMLAKFRTARKDEIAIAEVGQAIMDKTFSADPYDADTRKAVDGLSSAAAKVGTPEQNQLMNEEIVRQSGIVPKNVVNAIRAGLESNNAAEVAAAAQQANRLSQIDPAALGRRDGGKEAQNAADDFAHMVNNLNMTPEEAGQRIIDMNDPEKKRERKAIEPAAKEFVKEMQDFSLANEFDTFFGAEPSIGFSPGQQLGIQAEFLAIAEEQFYAANGDPEIAQNRAVEQMKRLYGVTELTGRKVVMKHPPENYWPKSAVGTTSAINPNAPGDPSLAYAQRQLEADLRAFSPDLDMSSVQLVTTPETDAMVKRGEMPGYAVLYKDADGVLQTIPGKLWRPDVTKAGEFNFQQQEDRVEGARAEQVQQRQQAPYRVQKPEDFMSGNDPVFGAR